MNAALNTAPSSPSTGQRPACALVMAGGTGGHIFPGLALAAGLRAAGWRVHWLGAPTGMEAQLVPAQGFAFEPVQFSGLRGKGGAAWLALPFKLLRACWQSWRVLRRVRPNVVLGMGGYISYPGALMAVASGRPLLLHEQNSVPGMANRWLAGVATQVFTAFPGVLEQARHLRCVGNPLREAFLRQAAPEQRFAGRSGPLRVLVVGGSLGAQALNDVVPKALALLPEAERPLVTHQSGHQHIETLRAHYAAAGVQGDCVPFIDDMAQAYADADWVICRAGATTVGELTAVGVASLLVPFPHAVDDHQSTNAQFLVQHGAGRLLAQRDLTPETLASLFRQAQRASLLEQAVAAKKLEKTNAVPTMVAACEELLR